MSTFLSRAVFAAACLSGALLAAPARAGDLSVTVEGATGAVQVMRLALFDDASQWPKGKATASATAAVAGGKATYVFKGLAPGRYALTGLADEHNDGKMHYSFIGIPEEGFFFSNDKHPSLSAPAFESCLVTIGGGETAITVHVQHWDDSH